ncbi:MAG: plasmid partition protein ParG [Rhabdochlamydiaceae bacterium]
MQKNTRVSVDFPNEWHVFLKMFCAKKGISIRQYIIDTVLNSIQGEVNEVDDTTFKKAADKLMKEKSALWKRLANRC